MARKSTRQEPQILDIIGQKEERLQNLSQSAENTIGIVRGQITNLNHINEQIDKEVEEIGTYISRLSAACDGLQAERTRNAQIASNFAKLICAE